ncbi:MAG: response regulator transcription factor [Clostridia bacterium]|nr:response regulator transcription factor [Clostridia bacterium]
MPEKKKVLVVDDQYVARSFFEIHVEMTRKYELVASLASAEQAIAYCLQNPVDLVIMDVMMKYGLDGLTCARTIKNNDPRVRIILTTSTAEAKWIEKARQAGIESFWFKEYSDIPLTEVMDRTMNGESVYPGTAPNPDFGEVRKIDLSERELEVLRELTRNLTNEEIGENLHISPHTVKRHIENMLAKTGYRNRIDLAVNAKLLGLVVHEEDRTHAGNGSGEEKPGTGIQT